MFGLGRMGIGMIKEQKGQSLVEFALVLPLLLLLICGIVDLGRLLFAYASLNMTTQEAVRVGGLGKAATTATAINPNTRPYSVIP